MPHVLHILPSRRPSGSWVQLGLLTEGLHGEGYRSSVAVLSADCDEPIAALPCGSELHLLGSRHPFGLPALRRFRRLVGELKPDVLHTWSIGVARTALLARVASFTGPVIAGVRRPASIESSLSWPGARQLLGRVDRVITNGTELTKVCAARGLNEQCIETIPDAVQPWHDDTSREARHAELTAMLELPEHTRLLLAVARLEHASRLKDLLWAIDLLQVIRDDVHLLLVGNGPLEDRLRRYCRQLTVDRRVHFLGCRDDVPRLLRGIDVFVAPGCSVVAPWAMVQAVASGVSVVAADSAVARETLPVEEHTRLVAKGDRAALARAINLVLDDDEPQHAPSQPPALAALQRHTAEAYLASYRTLYQQLLTASRQQMR
ncbi:MAG TPA: glycosyltransferase [Pirellulales bacterium]|nr:glycosyltransferase [Pirellulales bacterium]